MALPSAHDGPALALKVVLVGEAGIGKTKLIQRFLGGDEFSNEPSESTISPAYSDKDVSVDGQMVRLQIWDTAGQERFRAITKPFIRGSDVAIICFTRGTESTVPTWKDWVKSSVPLCRLIVCYTKCDLLGVSDRDGALETAERLAGQDAIGSFVTSAETGEGVEDLFLTVAQQRAPPTRVEPLVVKQPKKGQSGKCCGS